MRWIQNANKYKNVPTEIAGIKFPSKLEAKRYCQLIMLQKAGVIWELERQVRFKLHIGDGKKLFDYVPDFTYKTLDPERVGELTLEGKTTPIIHIAEDAKGALAYHTKIKIRWAEALYPEYRFKLWPEVKDVKKSKKDR